MIFCVGVIVGVSVSNLYRERQLLLNIFQTTQMEDNNAIQKTGIATNCIPSLEETKNGTTNFNK